MSKATGFLAFIFGAGIGSVATWYFVKKKYEQIAQEEIDSVKEVFSKRFNKDEELTKESYEDSGAYKKKAVDILSNYTTEVKPLSVDRPYVIEPNEFGDIFEYEQVSLTCYADNVLADEYNNLIDDVDDIVGEDFATHFGEYEEDSVFIRNDRLRCDYEILLDERKYDEVVKHRPRYAEEE